MIKKIDIKNFKVLENGKFECSNLNLFSGINGMGKSTALQTLLLLRQSYKNGYLKNNGLALKGNYVDVGVGKDALYQSAKREEIIFSLEFENNNTIDWDFAYNSDSDILPYKNQAPENIDYESISLFNQNFQYLNAERFVPEKFYDRSDFEVVQNGNIGNKGEFVAHYLSVYGNELVSEELCLKNSRSNTLIHQVWAWMGEITPGTKINVEELKGFDAVRLEYQFETNDGFTNEIKPSNVGFGLTYVLPVIVSLLSAKSGDILIIENPESHLHPKGQSIMGKLLALVSKLGVQLFVETHSDHVLNGIRVAVSSGIPSSNVKIFFLHRDLNSSEHFSKISCPKLDSDGRIDFWPDGFFDEWDNNLMKLI
ncbi:MAG: DUF3696 domain-containing protein [Flavobacteriia bacterium]|nr:DUF3696 domain-containing protein [Flavobacteriia bacterium]OJX39091.1 MAG: hypothetical protein BGO87_03640 [Flavobacteriia bacterium 40-80]